METPKINGNQDVFAAPLPERPPFRDRVQTGDYITATAAAVISAPVIFLEEKMGVGRHGATTDVGTGVINSLHGSNQASRGTVVASKPSRRKSCEHPSCHKQPAFS